MSNTIEPVTMQDVARAANVSQSTVSHVLNKTRRVSPDVVERVNIAIEQTGYTNDIIARSLRTGRTNTVGLAVSAISNPYFGEVVHAIERELSSAGYTIILVDSHDDPSREKTVLAELLSRRVDAVIVAPSEEVATVVRQLRARSVPAVLFDRIPEGIDLTGLDAIGVENLESMASLVNHFTSAGHSRIAMIAGRAGLTTSEERVSGFRLGMARAGIEVDENFIAYSDPGEQPAEGPLRRILNVANSPTAIITANNMVTIDAMRTLRALNMTVPDDLALASFDDFVWADFFHPRLTAIAQPLAELGHRAVTLLLERLENPDLPTRVETLKPTLMHRDSCGVIHAT
ncbi:LacI family DNA-binding transcriptional regulator [Rhodoglobus aureus]|uniref:LacI family DNA-binding transcriptional regulator n=1 Tax=Rhodoglobus aureus TaxID=191497 RepID=A0ABP4G2X6_9MICO